MSRYYTPLPGRDKTRNPLVAALSHADPLKVGLCLCELARAEYTPEDIDAFGPFDAVHWAGWLMGKVLDLDLNEWTRAAEAIIACSIVFQMNRREDALLALAPYTGTYDDVYDVKIRE